MEEAREQQHMQRMAAHVRTLLMGVGEDVDREGLKDTPKRVAKAFIDMMEGYKIPLSSALGTALFNEPIVSKGSGGLVLVRDIDFASTSEVTLLPFHGRCHIAYIPADGVVLGLSKLARLTKLAARRVQSQEALTQRVLRALNEELHPQGAVVVVDARHLSYAAPVPMQQLTAVASGSPCADAGELLDETLAMLGMGPEAGRLVVLEPRDEQQQDDPQCSGMQRSASGSDSPIAPVTPDPSERDDESLSAASSSCGADAEAEGDAACSCGDGDAADGMEAAMAALLAEAGVRDLQAPVLQAAVRRYVMSLLASTSGYHQELPALAIRQVAGVWHGARSPCCWGASSCGVTSHHYRQQQQQQRCSSSSSSSSSSSAQPLPSTPEAAAQTVAAAARAPGGSPPWHEHHVAFVSQCEHHMLPFYGTVHIAYILEEAGAAAEAELSQAEVEQVVSTFTQRLQVQERITQQVADAVAAMTGAPSVLVAVRAAHMCMVARGVENHAGSTLTRAASGEFKARPALRAEFLRAVAARGDVAAAVGQPRAALCGCR